MTDGAKIGVVGVAMQPGEFPFALPDQLPLLSAETGRVTPDDDPHDPPKQVLAGGKRGAGRPPGSRNRRTEDWLNYLFARYRSPLIGMAETSIKTPLDVARELGIAEPTPEQLISIWRELNRVTEGLAAYMHQKLPQLAELKLDTGGDQRSDAEILARIHELARRAGVPLGPVVDVTPQDDLGAQSNQQVTDDAERWSDNPNSDS